jgi:predicted amidohydrolase YtcJ
MPTAATLVLRHGKIITVDRAFSIAEAVAIGGDTILHVGNSAEMQPFIGPATHVIELGGACVIPGLIDAHAHMDREGLTCLFPSLAGAQSVREVVDLIAREVVTKQPGEWLVTAPLGTPPYHFDVAEMLAQNRVPTRWDLDAVSPENPVYIQAIWGYWGWPPLVSVLNSWALERCGLSRQTQPPWEGVEILKDRHGEPTGIILEHNFVPTVEFTLLEQTPRITIAQRVQGLRLSMQRYTAAGTTSIYEGHGIDPDLMLAYKRLWIEGAMTVRSHLLFTPPSKSPHEFREQLEDWARMASGCGIGDDWLRVGGICFQLSGNRTVAELRRRAKPYTSWAGHYHDPVTPEQLHELVTIAAENDLRVCVLADQIPNVDAVLSAFEAADRRVGIREKRFVIQHLQFATPPQLDRMKALGLVVGVHPNNHIWKRGKRHLTPEGRQQIDRVTPMRDLIDWGIPVTIETDGSPIELLHALWVLLARRERETGELIAPHQCVSRAEALQAATINGAYLTFEDGKKGSIEPGKWADVVVLEDDLLTLPEDRIKEIAIRLTVVGGQLVHEASPTASRGRFDNVGSFR